MRPAFIICIAVCTIFGCAKKTTPTGSADNKAAGETKTTTVTKVTTTTVTSESSMSIAGHSTFEAKCGRCHGLKEPSKYTVTEWVPILNKMAVKARLDSTEKANVLAYVTFHSKAG